MTLTGYDIAAILLALTAVLGFVNHRTLKLPSTIGLMVIALLASLGILALDWISTSWEVEGEITRFVNQIDFSQTLMRGMLGLLLFAGALHTQLDTLLERRLTIGALATIGVVISTLLVSTGVYFGFGMFGIEIPWTHALLFGALISPTDPIAVLGLLKTAGAPKRLEAKITGESLFNDGVGVVLFSVLLLIAGFGGGDHHHEAMGALDILVLFTHEVIGGMILGLAFGFLAYTGMKQINDHVLSLIVTLALVTFVDFVARQLHCSGPLAVVVSGLFIGNRGRRFAMDKETVQSMDTFWELLDAVLNSVLFLLIGLEVFALTFETSYLGASILSIAVVLLARFVAVSIPIALLRPFEEYGQGTVRLLTWGGVRGGISVALALSLPAEASREPILFCTYGVVLFSIIVQGLTLPRVVRNFHQPKPQ